MKKETREARERIETVARTNIGCEPRRLWLRPNDLRRVVDGLDEAEATEKLRAKLRDREARLKAANELWDRSLLVQGAGNDPDAVERLADALDLKNKHWRNPKHPKDGKR